MTLKELSQLYHLNREIEQDRAHIEELRAKAENATPAPLSDMPKSQSADNKMERYAVEIVDLSELIAAKQTQCIRERDRLMRYIIGIDDSLTRQIFTHRFIDGMGWDDVAAAIRDGYSVKTASSICYRYLKNAEKRGTRRICV